MAGNHIAELLKQTHLIPAPINKKVLTKADGSTRDIIAEVLQTYADSRNQLKQFGKFFKCNSLLETCQHIWHFWRKEVTYKIDPEGVQWIKTPAAFWHDDFGDCKSFSIAVAASLHALDIKGAFRFCSYGANKTAPTHVFVVVKDKGEEIIIDCVWHRFNETKAWSKKWDYNMTAIYKISGIETNNDRGMLGISEDNIEGMSAGELDLIAKKMLLEVEQGLAVKRSGIGSTHDNAYEVEIAAYNNAIAEVGKLRGNKKAAPAVKFAAYGHAGTPKKRVPQISPKNLTQAPKPGQSAPRPNANSKKLAKQIKRNDAGKGISKKNAAKLEALNVVVKKKKDGLLKSIVKVVTAPIRLTTKALTTTALRITLPKNAPFFLYLFLVDPKDPVRSAKILSKAPDTVMQKRDKALQAMDGIVKKIGMKEATFYTIIRAGIMKRFAASPEQVLAKWMTEANFQISGVLDFAAQGITALTSGLGIDFKNLTDFTPDPTDWGTAAPQEKNEMANDVKELPANNDVNTGKSTVANKTEDQIIKDAHEGEVQDSKGVWHKNTPTSYLDGSGVFHQGGHTDGKGVHQKDEPTSSPAWQNQGNNPNDSTSDPFTGENKMSETKPMKEVVITAGDGVTKDGEVNTGLWILGGVAALALLSGGNSRK